MIVDIEKKEDSYYKGLIRVEVTQPRIDVVNEVVYAQYFKNGTRSLHMTLFVPNTDEPKPCVVYFPGGGFTTSDYGKWSRLRMAMALQGFVVAAVEYRAIPDPFPAILIDGKTAIRYLRAHAVKFGIDGNRIGVMGNSAGGYLANQSYDIHDDLVRARWASPMGYLKTGLPPFLIMHGTNDQMVSIMQSEHLYDGLKALRVPVDYYQLKDAGHGDDPWFQQPVIELIVNWFRKQLMNVD